MSMKAVELQFALHKNDTAGMMQNQLSHKPQEDQSILANAAALSTEKQRRRSGKIDESASAGVSDSEKEKQQKQESSNRKRTGSNGEKPEGQSEHPYKGHHIDLSL
ncbi:hypothetical protein [Paenibacillus eucommiae]|uniref:Uncharacterized protein n=1 Tax=Paenibacillus eucommiae TaxID=1355755 RepID=A0ABS4IUQ2_9BACL|nr:hypothetical protein [Paenibacillus eucommiae]MBP1991310.1 hypothetical protein [Paenibacillus eucommiae]